MIKSIHNRFLASLSVDELPGMIQEEIKDLSDLLSYFTQGFTHSFDLTGLKEKYLRSQKPAIQVLDDAFRDQVRANLPNANSPLKHALNIGHSTAEFRNNVLYMAINKLFDFDDLNTLLKGTQDLKTMYNLFQSDYDNYDEIRVIDFISGQNQKVAFSEEEDLRNIGPERRHSLYQQFKGFLFQYLNDQIHTQ